MDLQLRNDVVVVVKSDGILLVMRVAADTHVRGALTLKRRGEHERGEAFARQRSNRDSIAARNQVPAG